MSHKTLSPSSRRSDMEMGRRRCVFGEAWCLIRSIIVTQFVRSHPELTFETLGTNKWKGSVINLFNMRGSALVDDTHKATNNELTDESLPELLGRMMMLVCDPVSINFSRIFLPSSDQTPTSMWFVWKNCRLGIVSLALRSPSSNAKKICRFSLVVPMNRLGIIVNQYVPPSISLSS